MSVLSATITKVCLGWTLGYITFGASSAGNKFFSHLVWWADVKGGLPLLTLTFPTLLATCTCSLLVIQRSRRSCLCPPKAHRWKVGRFWRPIFQRLLSNHGDGNFDVYATLFLLLPLVSYTCMGIRRHLHDLDVSGSFPLLNLLIHWKKDDIDGHTQNEAVMEIANTFAMMAVVAMGLFLIPTSRHGPIMKVFGWSHAMAIRLHIWAGRILVLGSLLHGLLHTIRWKYLLGENITAFILPPRQCWTSNDFDFRPICINEDTECTCHVHFLYFTGFVAGMLALVILLTTFHWLRRQSYRFFLLSHFLVAPLFLFVVIFHYHRAVLYMSPSLLYYLATTLPPYLERRRNVGVTVTSVEVIGTELQGQCISLTFEATRETVQAFRPGMYTQLSVPSISAVAHPFTVNRVVGEDDSLRIIFKVNGPFTHHLAVLLQAESGIPTIQMDGLHGSPTRMQQVRHHDDNVLIAGGIGITPFLSLLRDAVETNAEDGKILPQYASRLKALSIHWSCRNVSLIQYIRREYLDSLEGKITPYCQTRLHLYDTSTSSFFTQVEQDNEQQRQFSIRRLEFPSQTVQVTEPFRLSRFAPSHHIWGNIVQALAMVILVWPGLAIIWYSYTHYQSDDEFQGRGLAPIALLFYTGLMSFVFARVLPYHWFGKGNTQDIEFKLIDDESEHSYDERLPITPSSSAANLSNGTMDDESPNKVTIECHVGRPDLVAALEHVEQARWPAIFSCGPPSMSQHIQAIVNETSKTREGVASPLVTIYDEAFLM